jgi:hypothetical protein
MYKDGNEKGKLKKKRREKGFVLSCFKIYVFLAQQDRMELDFSVQHLSHMIQGITVALALRNM